MSKFSNFSFLNVNIFWCLSVQVETIRDAYMVVAGVPNKTTFHAHHICDMALDMLSSIDHLKDPSTGDNIQIRVGEQDSCQPRSGTLIISAVAGRREASSSGSATRHCLWTGRDSVSWSLFLRHLQAGLFIHSTTTTTRKYDLGILWHNRKIFCSTTEPLKKGHRDPDTDSFLSQGVTVLTPTWKHKFCPITVYIPNCVLSDLVNFFSWGLETGSRNSEAQTAT